MSHKDKKTTNGKPLSLYPMKLSEALKKAMKVPPSKKETKPKQD